MSGTETPLRWKIRITNIGVYLGMAVLLLTTWHLISPRSSPINYFLTAEALPAVPHDRRPETMDPATFTGKIAEAYRIARQRPALLEQMPCYCGCYTTFGHQNNLDCFKDRHSENCPICVEIAIRAEQLEKSGYSIADIKTLIDRRFAPRGGQKE
ncbi:MAG: hypothetical protein HY046_07455 [Acidobacteria bacterium]|nr:hypothetical protein [Acidobacteriota bacterium]